MANRIKILFESNPYIYSFMDTYMDFYLENPVTGFTTRIQKMFVPGVPTSINQIKVGVNLAATVVNIVENLMANNSYGVISYTAITGGFIIDFNPPGEYNYTVVSGPEDWFLSYEYYEVTATEDLLPLELEHDISIEIIDTYENDRVLIEEFTQIKSPRLTWEGGDDIDEPLMTSKLVFNMLVPDATDGKFFHLFSGDEQRYRVEVYSVKLDETKELIWRGFLLPDLYNEPYDNGFFFVEFTAVDMIASLKGKTLKSWYYNNRIPIGEVLAYCLQNTVLNQEFIVSPSLVPVAPYLSWTDINVPLYHYVDGIKYTDCYEILTDVLSSNGLTLCSFRGYWFVKGISRKHEAINSNSIVLNAAGIQTGLVNVINKVSEPMKLKDTPMINAVTPWKKVTIDVNQKTGTNILPDDIVVLNNEHLGSINQPSTEINLDYYNGIYNYFNKVGSAFSNPNSKDKFDYLLASGLEVRGFVNIYWMEYDIKEQDALKNYFQYKKKTFLLANTEYTLEIESTIYINAAGQFEIDYFPTAINRFKNCFVFQLLLNNNEIVSNRPSFYDKDKYLMKFENRGIEGSNPHIGTLKYSLKTTFSTTVEGYLDIRILFPIFRNVYSYEDVFSYQIYNLTCESFKITPVKNADEQDENTIATRPVSFTQKKNIPINFTSTKNELLRNNFGLNYPVNVGDYFYPVSVENNRAVAVNQYTIFSKELTELTGVVNLRLWDISYESWIEIFGNKLLRNNLYLKRLNGSEEAFKYVLGNRLGYVLAYIIDKSLSPKIPKNYPVYDDETPEVATPDFLYYMDVKYENERIEDRGDWKLYGFSSAKTFVKTLASMFHYVRPESCFSLEATFLQVIFPNELIAFEYMNEVRNFIPTRLELDLTDGKTTVKTIEAKFTELTDIVYE